MAENNIPLQPGQIFHIYNHAIAKENLFERDADYIYFLDKMKLHLTPVCSVLSYCLLPNHYHLLVQFKTEEELKKYFSHKIKSRYSIDELIKQNEDYLSRQISQVFSNFFNTYAKHFNFVKSRTGTLFKRTFRRKEITDIVYLQKVICYMHQNPVAAKFASGLGQWKYTSYNAIVGNGPTLIDKAFVINTFDDMENFLFCHSIISQIDLE